MQIRNYVATVAKQQRTRILPALLMHIPLCVAIARCICLCTCVTPTKAQPHSTDRNTHVLEFAWANLIILWALRIRDRNPDTSQQTQRHRFIQNLDFYGTLNAYGFAEKTQLFAKHVNFWKHACAWQHVRYSPIGQNMCEMCVLCCSIAVRWARSK